MITRTLAAWGLLACFCLSTGVAARPPEGSESRPDLSFDELDRNDDDRLEAGELNRHELREADRDGNRAVSREEYFRYIRRAARRG